MFLLVLDYTLLVSSFCNNPKSWQDSLYLLDSKIHISGCRYEKILKFGEEKVDISIFQTQLELPQSDF